MMTDCSLQTMDCGLSRDSSGLLYFRVLACLHSKPDNQQLRTNIKTDATKSTSAISTLFFV